MAGSNTQRMQSSQRARSVPYARPFITAIATTVLLYLSLTGLGAALFAFFVLPSIGSVKLLIAFLVSSVLLWIISYLKRRDARCPLCKGTPLLDSAAHRHIHARRLFPLNYGTSAVLSCLLRQKYSCQYCGTPFDLLKRPDKQAPLQR